MSAPVWLIAAREFRTYVATASFWVALAVGPLAMGGASALIGNGAAPISVSVRASDPALARSATAALEESARVEGRHYALSPAKARVNRLVLVREADGTIEARFNADFPLSLSGRTLVARILERDGARDRLATDGDISKPIAVRQEIEGKSASGRDTGILSRFSLVMILWLTLTGSLGMLLQAVVRERANRTLESLLAAARPWEIVTGKLAGVGAVSALVLAVWLGSAVGFAVLGSTRAGFAQSLFSSLAAPTMLTRAVAIYLSAYIFYGLVTIALGSAARDAATAQNMSRPMFVVLLTAFCVALATVSGMASGLAWLLYVPPFTPFLLLLRAPGEISGVSQAGAMGLMLVATVAAGWLALGRLTLRSEKPDSRTRL
jgi:ABC-2 type transport system permease protein